MIYLVLLANTISIVWLIYASTFNKLVKFIDGANGDKGELTLIPVQHLLLPILSIVISSFIIVKKLSTEK